MIFEVKKMSEQICPHCDQVIEENNQKLQDIKLFLEFSNTETGRKLIRRTDTALSGFLFSMSILLGLVFLKYLNSHIITYIFIGAGGLVLTGYFIQTLLKRNRLFKEFKAQRRS